MGGASLSCRIDRVERRDYRRIGRFGTGSSGCQRWLIPRAPAVSLSCVNDEFVAASGVEIGSIAWSKALHFLSRSIASTLAAAGARRGGYPYWGYPGVLGGLFGRIS